MLNYSVARFQTPVPRADFPNSNANWNALYVCIGFRYYLRSWKFNHFRNVCNAWVCLNMSFAYKKSLKMDFAIMSIGYFKKWFSCKCMSIQLEDKKERNVFLWYYGPYKQTPNSFFCTSHSNGTESNRLFVAFIDIFSWLFIHFIRCC